MKIFLRLLALPAVLIVQIIISVVVIITHAWKFLRFGGEFIIYDKRNQAKTILDCYQRLEHQQQVEVENKKLMEKLKKLEGDKP